MGILGTGLRAANRVLRHFDAEIVRKRDLIRIRDVCILPEQRFDESALPSGAQEYLRPDNPRLAEIRSRYRAALPAALAPSRWTDDYKEKTIDMRFFRGHNSYVFSDLNWEFKYAITAYYAKAIDRRTLLSTVLEDGRFGCPSVMIDNAQLVSRDLLDSLCEIYFLDRMLGPAALSGVNVLDIGAGYGRLAHRLTAAVPSIGSYLCVDAVPESSFLCEYYLGYRNAGKRARTVLFDEVEATLQQNAVDLAVNIHSFSECTSEAIAWWLNLLARHRVRYLMVVPNPHEHGGNLLLSQEKNGGNLDFGPLLASRGYHRIGKLPKYGDPLVQRYGISPTYHHLFELR